MVLLVIGGSGSGKSEYAEQRAVALHGKKEDGLFYIATMEPYDEESHRRIKRHRQMRKDRHFNTIECYTGLEKLSFLPGSTLLLECISNLTANEMFGPDGCKEDVVKTIIAGLCHLKEQAEHLVIVANNVFSDGIEYDAATMEYIRQMAMIQNQAAQWCDQIVEVTAGIPLLMPSTQKPIKGETNEIHQ